MSEDPGLRRSPGGGTNRILFQIIPLYQPQIREAYHASDFTPVTSASPARAGESLILRAGGLGPLTPGTTPPGLEAFPEIPAEVNSPVEVTVNGRPAVVANKVGWPGETDVYRVDIQLPSGIEPGQATLQITAGWVPGTLYRLSLR
jgi:uncharacterized protein (TIGR03437 family)